MTAALFLLSGFEDVAAFFFFVECVFGTAVLPAFSVAAATAVPEFVLSPAVIFCCGSITLPVTFIDRFLFYRKKTDLASPEVQR